MTNRNNKRSKHGNWITMPWSSSSCNDKRTRDTYRKGLESVNLRIQDCNLPTMEGKSGAGAPAPRGVHTRRHAGHGRRSESHTPARVGAAKFWATDVADQKEVGGTSEEPAKYNGSDTASNIASSKKRALEVKAESANFWTANSAKGKGMGGFPRKAREAW